MLKVILPDGSAKEFPGSVAVKEVAGAIRSLDRGESDP